MRADLWSSLIEKDGNKTVAIQIQQISCQGKEKICKTSSQEGQAHVPVAECIQHQAEYW